MKQLSQKDVKQVREDLLKKNNFICPICETELSGEDAALDHCHITGQIRGTICKKCNSLEGIWRSRWIRVGLKDIISYEQLLYNMYKYLLQDNLPMLHPTHKPKPRKLQKRSYQELKKEITQANKFLKRKIKIPPYPKSGRLTKRLKELFEQFNIIPKFYK